MPDKFNISGDFAFDMVNLLDMPAHIKDASSRKYIHCNTLNLEIYGLDKIDQIVGKTVIELDGGMKNYWGSEYADQVNQMDYDVVYGQKPVVDVRTILTINGLVRLQRMAKAPLIHNKKTLAIFTFSQNLTRTLNIQALYDQYKVFYPKKIAVKKFLTHLDIIEYFSDLPTDSELNVLIAKVSNSRTKELSTQLHLSPKTIEFHSLNLRNKMQNEDLFKLLFVMRSIDIT